MITIELPWPSSDLSPNARVHWTVRDKATEQAKHDAYYLALHEIDLKEVCKLWDGKNLRATWTFHPPNLSHFDEDGIKSRCKPYQDGVCMALGVDDFQIKESSQRMSDVDRPDGRVVMTLEAM